jgi:hypothetical protein
MPAPTSLKGIPHLYIDPDIRRIHMISYLLHIWLSFIPAIIFEAFYLNLYYITPNYIYWIYTLLIPINILLVYYLTILISIIIMKIRLAYLIARHKPREGIFKRDINNKDYKFHSLRNYARYFPAFMISTSPLPWFRRILFYKAFGIKIGKGGIQEGSWLPVEFVEIGENAIIGMGTVIMSYIIESDYLLIQKIKIGNNVIVGSKSTIYPGVTIEDNAILAGISEALVGQTLKKDCVYYGYPATYINKIDEIDFDVESIIKRNKKFNETH